MFIKLTYSSTNHGLLIREEDIKTASEGGFSTEVWTYDGGHHIVKESIQDIQNLIKEQKRVNEW